jgi:E3 SUMO-protein ligase RanBP2
LLLVPFVFDPINPDDEDEVKPFEPSYQFPPVVVLRPVEVATGEEDEDILFCERAKLYRFDSLTNEMKERGTGEMKILQHRTTTLCRVLMRREQIFKVCANHTITSQMELKPHKGTANVYVWTAIDHADGVGKPETLCVRFKSEEQAKQFVKVFNEAKEKNVLSSIGKISLSDDGRIKKGYLFL